VCLNSAALDEGTLYRLRWVAGGLSHDHRHRPSTRRNPVVAHPEQIAACAALISGSPFLRVLDQVVVIHRAR
jgi:hypothetical protein